MPTGARVHIYGDWDGSGVKKAQQDLSFFEKQSGAFSSSFSKSMLGVGAAFGGAFAVGNLIGNVTDYLRDAAVAAMEDEKSVRALAQALQNVGMATAAGEAEKLVTAFSKQYAVADDDLRPALQRLVTATGDVNKSQDLLQTALDLSAAGYGSVEQAAKALAKASTGQVSALTRLGIPLDANIVKTKDFAAALEVVNQRFGGQAAAAADTYAGQLKSLQIAADEAQETIGYALLNALDGVSDAFGGTSGAVGAIEGFGAATANLVTGIGELSIAMADFTATVTNSRQQGVDWGDMLRNLAIISGAAFPPIGFVAGALEKVGDFGAVAAERTQAMNDSLAGSEALYAGYASSLDNAAAAQRDLEMDAEDAKQALEELKAAVKGVNDELNQSQSMDDFRFKLANLDADIAKNSRSFDGMGEAAKKNRDTLRDALGDASKIAQDFAGEGEGAADRFEAKYGQLGSKVVRQFVDQGFKKKDIREFLKDEGLWTAELQRILDGVDVNDESQKLGYLIGMDLTRGVVKGLGDGTPAVRNQAARLVREAEASARTEAQTGSPSKLFAEVGADIADGLGLGMNKRSAQLWAAGQSMVEAIAQGAEDSFGRITSVVDGALSALSDVKGGLEKADQDIADWVQSTRDNLVSAFDPTKVFDNAFDENGKFIASKFTKGWEAEVQAFQWQNNVLTAIRNSPGGEQLATWLESQGLEKGAKWGQGLIDGGLVKYMIDQLPTVTNTAETTAQAMVPSFLTAAQQSARATYDEFVANYGKDGPLRKALNGLMDRLANSMNRTATVTVETRYVGGTPPGRATGGSVTGGSPYIIGERGPELFVPNTSGYVVPNSGLRSSGGGGNSYNITVQAGVGDPRQIGQQVVEYIKRFEKANGQVFAAA